MKRLAIITCLVVAAVAMQAQNVTFCSAEFEEGIHLHLELPAGSQVMQSQLDTITRIDLSGLGIKDIRDVVYLPAVKHLNLSYNELKDISPLLSLDSLRYVNLSYNLLENINVLAMSCTDSMEVDISNNYLKDFSYFFTPTLCQFNLVGMYLQLDKSAQYMDVYHLYCDVNEAGKPVVAYRGYTNVNGAPAVKCNGKRVTAVLDGGNYTVLVPGWPTSPMMVTLTLGEQGDTTWVLPPVMRRIAAGANVDIETGLPEGYRIGTANALHGEVTVDGTNLSYTAPADLERDTVYISYYEGWQLRGFTEYRMLNVNAVEIGDVDGDGLVNIYDVTMLIQYLLKGDATGINLLNADCYPDGRISIDDVAVLINYLLKGRWD